MTPPARVPIRIRELRASDLSAVRAWMSEEPAAPSWSGEDLALLVSAAPPSVQSARRVRRAWLAEDDHEQPLGFAVVAALRIDHAPAECELEFIFVLPQVRRSGIARALLDSVAHWTRNFGAQQIWLEVRSSNAPAIALYTRIGFASVGIRPGYYTDPPEDALLMRCTITAPV